MNKKLLAVAIAGAVAAPMAAQAIDFSVSGHVNRMIRFADDGTQSDVNFVDNEASNTRFRMRGSEDIGGGITAGILIELEVVSNNSSAAGIFKANDAGDPGTTQTRFANLFFAGDWGRVTLGQLSVAKDGTSFADLSGTWLVNEFSSGEHGSGLAFRTSAGAVATSNGNNVTLSNVYSSFDGARRDGIRYDSPAFGPVTAAVSVHQNSVWSAGLFASTSLGGGELSAAIGYEDLGGTMPATPAAGATAFVATNAAGSTVLAAPATPAAAGADDCWSASASYLFSQGTSITLAYGEGGNLGAPDGEAYYAKLGHQWGNHAVSIHYGNYDEVSQITIGGVTAGTEMEMIGIGWVYSLRNDIELYAGYNNFDLDNIGATSFDDLDIAVVGSRIMF